jgi:pre-mRNA-splicing helicase BRR2
VHGTAEPFYVIVEDVDQEHILHYELFILKKKFAEDDHSISFTIPIFDPLPPQVCVSLPTPMQTQPRVLL